MPVADRVASDIATDRTGTYRELSKNKFRCREQINVMCHERRSCLTIGHNDVSSLCFPHFKPCCANARERFKSHLTM